MPNRRARSRLRQDQRLADSFAQPIRRTMRAERQRVLAAGSEAGARRAVSDAAWKATLGTIWMSDPVLDLYREQVSDLGGDVIPREVAQLRRLLNGFSNEHAVSIAEQQRDLISTALANAEKEFRSQERRAVRELYDEMIPKRGGRLAFTEALQASETAKYEGARSVVVNNETQLVKVWFTVGDTKVRDSHAAVNGQSRVVTQKRGGGPGMFRVGGAALEYPRDPRGPAQEVINCRCFLEFRRRRRRR